MATVTKTSYVLMVKGTNDPPLRVERTPGYHARLVSDAEAYNFAECPVFECATLEAAVQAIHFAPIHYNSDVDRPTLGKYKAADLEVGKMEVATSLETVDHEPPPILDDGVVDTHDYPFVLARKLVPDVPKLDKYALVQLDSRKQGITEDRLRSMVGQVVYFGDVFNKRRLLGVAKAREEYAEFCDFELVCTEAIWP